MEFSPTSTNNLEELYEMKEKRPVKHQQKRADLAKRYEEAENIYRKKKSQLRQMRKLVWIIPVSIGILVFAIWEIEKAAIASFWSVILCYILYSRSKWGIEREWNDIYDGFFQESINIDEEFGISPYPK